jgi:hypothetical protein
MQRINLLCPTIRRQSRKIGRNEPCPCGRTKERVESIPAEEWTYCGDQPIKTRVVIVPMKYKHCCGDVFNQRKAAKVRRLIQQHFGTILGTPRKQGKLSMIANKIKSLFKFGSK